MEPTETNPPSVLIWKSAHSNLERSICIMTAIVSLISSAIVAMKPPIANGTLQTVANTLHKIARANTPRRLGSSAGSATAG
mgnify:CR=1 FL=1